MSSPTSDASARPRRFLRATSEEPDANYRDRQAIVDNHRALLERTWSTPSVMLDEGQQRSAATARDAVSAEFTLAQSWSNGFGDGTDNLAAFAESWTTDTATSNIAGGDSVSPVNLPPTHRAVGSGGEPSDRRNSLSSAHSEPQGGDDLTISSAIHDAARIKDYPRVKELCLTNPNDAQFVAAGGWTALHHLCDRRCPEVDVVQACIRACPEALVKEDTKGWTPLHFACRNKSPTPVVRELLYLYPDKGKISAAKPDSKRRSPLWYAVRYEAPPGVVPMLLEVDPSVVLSDDQHSESPLALVWDSWAEKLEGTRTLHPYLHPEQTETGHNGHDTAGNADFLLKRIQREPGLLSRWKQANMFLKASFRFPLIEGEELADAGDRKWRILHATAAVKCHPTLFLMACALHPEQAKELDEDDLYGRPIGGCSDSNTRQQTALHLAASSNASGSSGQSIITTLLRLYPDAAQMPDGTDGSYPLHRIVENKHKHHWTFDGVNPLYMMNPRAVQQPDRNGKLPLHRAAAAISPQESTTDLPTRSVICNLVEVYPQGAAIADAAGCLPLHLISMNGQEWNEEVNPVYEAHHAAVTSRTGPRFDNSLPIHLAAANPFARSSLIERLVQLNPRGVSQADRQGKLPLHLVCELGKDWTEAGVEAIYDAFPQAIRMREDNERHWMALHMASSSQNDCRDLISKLVDIHREACEMPDPQGRFPLHLACEAGKNWLGGLEAIFEGNALAISYEDNQGRLPFYIAATGIASRAPGEEMPNGADPENTESDLDAVTRRSLQAEDELDILFNLLRADPTILPHS